VITDLLQDDTENRSQAKVEDTCVQNQNVERGLPRLTADPGF
jgi:hypothetical protein